MRNDVSHKCSFRLNDLWQPVSSHLKGLSPTCDLRCCIRCSFRLNDLLHTLQAVKLTPSVPLIPPPDALFPFSADSCFTDRAEMAFICCVAAMGCAVWEPSVESLDEFSWSSRASCLRLGCCCCCGICCGCVVEAGVFTFWGFCWRQTVFNGLLVQVI